MYLLSLTEFFNLLQIGTSCPDQEKLLILTRKIIFKKKLSF